MVAKRPASKKSLVSKKAAGKKVSKKPHPSKQQQEQAPEKAVQLSKSKLKKQEFQRKKYNKDKKKTKQPDEDDDSDFEIVPTTTTNAKGIMDSDSEQGDDGLVAKDDEIALVNDEDDDDDDEDSDSDLELDMFGKFKAKKPAAVAVAAPAASVKKQKPITMNDSDEEDEQDEKFIASETLAANRKNKKSGGFQSMGLSNPVFKAVIHKGFKVPTPVQRKCIPLILQGDDVVGMARTGSGKTAAFLIPMLEKLKVHSAKTGARGLVLSPSRELALQTQKVCKELMKYTDLRSGCIVGGDSLDEQFEMIASNPDILIATPGRLLHLAVEMNLDLRTIEYVVFDEADRLFEMGFAVQLHEILSRLPPSRQTLLFSATLPKMLVDFAKAGLQEPTLVRLDVDTKISRDLEMAFFSVKDNEKEGALLYLLKNVIKLPKRTQNEDKADVKKYKKKKGGGEKSGTEADRQTILFAATKHHVEYLATLLEIAGYQVSYVYGSLDQTARNIQINRFRNGVTNILVVTDVAARGIDIPILENVINYDFAGSSKVFVHRVGRAARAGRRGWAYSFVSADELPYLVDLQLFLTRPLVLGGEKDEYDYTGELVLGAMPKDSLIDDKAWADDKIAKDAALEGTYKTAMNAYKLYNRTKPRAAAESYGRAKDILKKKAFSNLHPLLLDDENQSAAEIVRANMISAISGFRPAETIFEFGVRGTRKLTPATVMMRGRRQVVDKIITAHKSQKEAESAVLDKPLDIRDEEKVVQELGGNVEEEELAQTFIIPELSKEDKKKKTSFRDQEFYMSYTQKDANTERGYSMSNQGSFMEQASKAQLDLTGDDNDAIKKSQNMLRWDSKKRKFIKGTGIGSDNKKLIRTESGALISATYKSGRFDEWAKKKHITLPRAGERELDGARNMGQKRFRHNKSQEAKRVDPLAFDYEKKMKKRRMNEPDAAEKGGMGKKRVGDFSNTKSELKNASQIRKDRVALEKRREKSNRPSSSGRGGKARRGRGGGGGGGGGGGRGGGRGRGR
ncbi:hypothetical protein [Parasitella parasitica]|uniref:RNA helicase n=1 Tax=Parasitella parasitica TaxID=35722 RepID=A0A0B7NM35_9FUNG|nr:hypothetical protein [Parasitella parasitica]